MALVLNAHRSPGKIVIERVSYLRDSGGKRETKYLGRIPSNAPFDLVPNEIIEKLTEDEIADLKTKLLSNEPREFELLHRLKEAIYICKKDIENIQESEKKSARAVLSEVENAWKEFTEHAQKLGVKRSRNVTRSKPGA